MNLKFLHIILPLLPVIAVGETAPLTFEKQVRPILKAHCFQCHGEEEEHRGKLDTRLQRFLLKGGESGPAVVPGVPEESRMFRYVRDGKMPKGDKKLTSDEVATIRDWIAGGAKTVRPEPESIGPGYLTEEERAHWAFQPVKKPNVPNPAGGNTPIDKFLLERLQKEGLNFSPQADQVALICRLYLDLIGLPPPPEEVDEFVADQRPDAYELLVERLLSSPHYGERWGRHWLDVAGYSDSEGYDDDDSLRPNAFRYRDFVVKSFNEDMPFDQFIREQLAGDEMVPMPYQDLKEDEIRKLTATGFLRMVPDGTGGRIPDQVLGRHEVMRATVKQVSSALLGLTVACAECHDHRYDPIPQDDYYRLRAIFEPAIDWKRWRNPSQRRVSLLTTDEIREAAEIEKQAQEVESVIQPKLVENQKFIFESELLTIPEELREQVKAAGLAFQAAAEENRITRKPIEMLSPENEKLLAKYPSLKVDTVESRILLFLSKYENKLKELNDFLADVRKRAADIRKTKPEENFVRALTETPGPVPQTYIFARGNRSQPGKVVTPGSLSVLSTDGPFELQSDAPNLPSTGRRLAYAEFLTRRSHPLTARVLVNRVWMHHFGRGIVASPSNFGTRGEKPTHPELLDWLAAEFMDKGWSMKHLHRLVVNSAAYRQSSSRHGEGQKIDSENVLYWRMPIRRLEAEAVRDTILAVSGTLNRLPFGAPVTVTPDANQQMVVGTDKPSPGGDENRRSIYVQRLRTSPAYVLEVFDEPLMEPICELRDSSTVAPQALLLMNSSFILEQADAFARRVIDEAEPDSRSRVIRAWRLAYGATPSDSDVEDMVQYLGKQFDLLKDKIKPMPKPAQVTTAMKKEGEPEMKEPDPPTPESKALASLCQVLLASNRLLYVH